LPVARLGAHGRSFRLSGGRCPSMVPTEKALPATLSAALAVTEPATCRFPAMELTPLEDRLRTDLLPPRGLRCWRSRPSS
jgi:hypothetical protein